MLCPDQSKKHMCACASSLQEIKDRQNASGEDLKQLEDAFKLTTDVVWQIWGERACRYAVRTVVPAMPE
jgi:hypothetical protein